MLMNCFLFRNRQSILFLSGSMSLITMDGIDHVTLLRRPEPRQFLKQCWLFWHMCRSFAVIIPSKLPLPFSLFLTHKHTDVPQSSRARSSLVPGSEKQVTQHGSIGSRVFGLWCVYRGCVCEGSWRNNDATWRCFFPVYCCSCVRGTPTAGMTVGWRLVSASFTLLFSSGELSDRLPKLISGICQKRIVPISTDINNLLICNMSNVSPINDIKSQTTLLSQVRSRNQSLAVTFIYLFLFIQLKKKSRWH